MAKLKINNGMPHLELTRSSHNLSNQKIFDVEQNWLVPTAVYDCIPGDKFNLGTSHLIRTTPLIKPAFTIDLMAKTMSAFVSYRTIWKPFEDFFSGGRTGNKIVPLPVINFSPQASYSSFLYSIFDYFDLPTTSSNQTEDSGIVSDYINALYFLAYLKIWNDYFRNPSIDIEIDVLNLTIYKPNNDTPYTFDASPISFTFNNTVYQAESVSSFIAWCFGLISGSIPLSDLTSSNQSIPLFSKYGNFFFPAKVNLPRDLFTSALPTASSSDPVSLSVSGSASGSGSPFSKDVYVNAGSRFPSASGLSRFSDGRVYGNALNKGTLAGSSVDNVVTITGAPSINDNSNNSFLYTSSSSLNDSFNLSIGNIQLSGIYPRELRLVFGLDLKQQIRNLTGNRYQDLLYAFYGVTTQDYRLNMAEYIGGSRSPIYTSEVLQTSESSQTPLGEQGGHAISSGVHKHGSYFVRELGCIINLFWINSSMPYCQSLRRDWRKFSINDFFFPMFENLGDQELLQEEISYSFTATPSSKNFRIFGFVPRYSEYKFYNHTVCGGIRGNYKYWTQSRFFSIKFEDGYPVLSSSFIKPDTQSVNRIFQTIDADYTLKPYIVKFENRTIAYRPMVDNSLGYLIDHF